MINEIDDSGMIWFWHWLHQWQKVLLFSLGVRQTCKQTQQHSNHYCNRKPRNRNYFAV